jgi:hypothetical protein
VFLYDGFGTCASPSLRRPTRTLGCGVRPGSLGARGYALGHAWVATTMNYIHVHATHVEDAWVTGQQRAADRLKGLLP